MTHGRYYKMLARGSCVPSFARIWENCRST